MFGFIKKCFFTAVTFLSCNPANISTSDQRCFNVVINVEITL